MGEGKVAILVIDVAGAIQIKEMFPDADLTDDAGLLRKAGFPVALVLNGEPNIKLTIPADLTILRALI